MYNLPIKNNGDSQVLLGELADIRLTFEDRAGTARFNGDNTVALQVVKRKGFNLIDTANLVRAEVEARKPHGQRNCSKRSRSARQMTKATM